MNTDQKINLIKTVPMFHSLTAPDFKLLAEIASYGDADSGDVIINENSSSEEVFVILEGRVDIFLSNPGSARKDAIAELKPGDIIGELSLLGKTRRIASAITKDKIKYLSWEKNALAQLCEKHHNIGFALMREIAKVLADRLYSTNMVLRNAIANNAAQLNK